MQLTHTSYPNPKAPPLRALTFTNEAVGEFEAYIAIWGDSRHRDSYDTWFDRAHPPEMAIDFLPFPLLMEHGQLPGLGVEVIGSVNRVWFDDIGIKCGGFLDQSQPSFNHTKRRIANGELFTSSASGGHVADFDNEGRFVKWLLTELSLTSSPAESRMPSVSLIRSSRNNLIAMIGTAGGRNALSDEIANSENNNHSLTIRMGESLMLPQNPGGAPPAPPVTTPAIVPNQTQPTTPPPAPPMPAPTRAPLDQLLVDPNTPPEVIINALVEGGLTPDDIISMLQQGQPPAAGQPAPTEGLSSAALPGETPQARALRLLQNALNPTRSAPAAPPAQQTVMARLALENMFLRARAAEQQNAPPAGNPSPVQTRNGGRGGGGGQITNMVDRKFDHLSAEEMALGYMVMDRAARSGFDTEISENYVKIMAYKLAHAMDRNDAVATDPVVMRSFPIKGKGTAKRSDEVMQSTLVGHGDEWVYDYQGTALWEVVRQETLIYQEMLSRGMDEKEIPQGYESETIPLEGSDPTWYVTPQTTDFDASSGMPTPKQSPSQFGTDKKNITVAKLSCVIPISGELEEDSIINVVQEANRKMRISATEQIETILLNGDTTLTTNTNINLIDGTPSSAPTQPSYTLLNGLLKLPLVTNTAMKRDASTTFDETDFLATLQLLPKALRQNRARLMYILDSDTAIAASNITTLKTRDVFTAATLEEGTLVSIWKVDVFETGFMELANSSGKVPTAGGTLGRLLCVRPDQWASRWKRRLRVEVERYAMSDTRIFVAHMRWGLAFRKNNVAAVSYNIPVTLS